MCFSRVFSSFCRDENWNSNKHESMAVWLDNGTFCMFGLYFSNFIMQLSNWWQTICMEEVQGRRRRLETYQRKGTPEELNRQERPELNWAGTPAAWLWLCYGWSSPVLRLDDHRTPSYFHWILINTSNIQNRQLVRWRNFSMILMQSRTSQREILNRDKANYFNRTYQSSVNSQNGHNNAWATILWRKSFISQIKIKKFIDIV